MADNMRKIDRRFQDLRTRMRLRRQAGGRPRQPKGPLSALTARVGSPMKRLSHESKSQAIKRPQNERRRRLEDMQKRKIHRQEMEILTAQTNRLMNQGSSILSLLQTLNDFDLSTATTRSVGEIIVPEMRGFISFDGTGKIPLGTLNGWSCYLSLEELTPEVLHNKTTPPSFTSMHPLLRYVEMCDEYMVSVLKFKAICLGKLVMDDSELDWVVLVSERKDVWALRAQTLDHEEASAVSPGQVDDAMQDVEHTSAQSSGLVANLFDGVAAKLGTLEQMMLRQEKGLGLIDVASVTPNDRVREWWSALVSAGHLD